MARGFTLLELVAVVSIFSILTYSAAQNFVQMQVNGRTRSAARHFTSLVQEARNAGLLLASAQSTARVDLATGGNCGPEFNARDPITPAFGRAALVIDAATQRVSYVSQVVRDPTANPATYEIWCQTVDFDREYRSAVHFDIVDASANLSTGSTPTIRFTTFDSRGFLSTAPPDAGQPTRIVMRESGPDASDVPYNVIILGSGLACPEGAEGRCAGRN